MSNSGIVFLRKCIVRYFIYILFSEIKSSEYLLHYGSIFRYSLKDFHKKNPIESFVEFYFNIILVSSGIRICRDFKDVQYQFMMRWKCQIKFFYKQDYNSKPIFTRAPADLGIIYRFEDRRNITLEIIEKTIQFVLIHVAHDLINQNGRFIDKTSSQHYFNKSSLHISET